MRDLTGTQDWPDVETWTWDKIIENGKAERDPKDVLEGSQAHRKNYKTIRKKSS